MSNFDELIGVLKNLINEQFTRKMRYVTGVLGDGTGRVNVPGKVDYAFARFSRGATDYFEIFNKSAPYVHDWPVKIGQKLESPGLTQVVDTDWDSYIQSGWGDSITTNEPHAPTHVWRDGFIGADPLDIYTRSIAPGRAYSTNATGSIVYVNAFEYHTGTIWPGLPGVDLAPIMGATATGTARFAGVYVQANNTLGVVTGTTTVDTPAFDPPLVTFPWGTIPIARVRIGGGQAGIRESDFRDARRLWELPATGTASGSGEQTFPAWGEIVLLADDGSAAVYTDITLAAAAAASGDTVLFGPGTFVTTATTTFVAGVDIVGQGIDVTIIDHNNDSNAMVIGGDISDLTIDLQISSASNRTILTRAGGAIFQRIKLYGRNTGAGIINGLSVTTGAGNSTVLDCIVDVDGNGISHTNSPPVMYLVSGVISGTTTAISAAGGGIEMTWPLILNGTVVSSGVGGGYQGSAGNLFFRTGTTDIMTLTSAGLALASGARLNEFSIDGTLAGNSDVAAPTEKAVKTYVDANAGAPDDAQYYVAALHAGLSAEIVPGLDTFKVSKLRQLDDGGDALVSDNDGNLTMAADAYIDMDKRASVSASPGAGLLRLQALDDAQGGRLVFRNPLLYHGIRPTLQDNLELFVNGSTGNDSNSGLNSGAAFATIQKAVDVASSLDLSSFTVTINVANGTYTASNTLKSFIGSGSIIIVGDETTPSNVIISTTSANCFDGDNVRGQYHLRGMRLQTTTSGSGISISNGTFLKFQALDFGVCVGPHMSITQGAFIQATGNYSITGGSTRHHNIDIGGGAQITGRTITLTGTPAFSSAFCFMNTDSFCALGGNTYSGSATGTRYFVGDSHCNVAGGGANYFPGNAAGSTANGGQYY